MYYPKTGFRANAQIIITLIRLQAGLCLCCWDLTYGHSSFLMARSMRFQLNRLENYHVTGDCRSPDYKDKDKNFISF